MPETPLKSSSASFLRKKAFQILQSRAVQCNLAKGKERDALDKHSLETIYGTCENKFSSSAYMGKKVVNPLTFSSLSNNLHNVTSMISTENDYPIDQPFLL